MTAINLATFTDRISDRQLEQLSRDNPETRFETTPLGELIIMSPQSRRLRSSSSTTGDAIASRGSESGRKNTKLVFQVELWNFRENSGVTFDSSTGFKLSNGATRSPDVSWMKLESWQAIPKAQQRSFAPIDPDFASQRVVGVPPIVATDEGVIELMSPTDDLDELRNKMNEYISCGVKLGWLICPDEKQVEIYRQGERKKTLDNPGSLSGEDILPGLTVDLTDIFSD